jgi:hypothetical protein
MRAYMRVVLAVCAIVETGILCTACSNPPSQAKQTEATEKTEPTPEPALVEIATSAALASASETTGAAGTSTLKAAPKPEPTPVGIPFGTPVTKVALQAQAAEP